MKENLVRVVNDQSSLSKKRNILTGKRRIRVHAGPDSDRSAGLRGGAEDRPLPLAEDHQARLQEAETDARRGRGRRGQRRGGQGEGAHIRLPVSGRTNARAIKSEWNTLLVIRITTPPSKTDE